MAMHFTLPPQTTPEIPLHSLTDLLFLPFLAFQDGVENILDIPDWISTNYQGLQKLGFCKSGVAPDDTYWHFLFYLTESTTKKYLNIPKEISQNFFNTEIEPFTLLCENGPLSQFKNTKVCFIDNQLYLGETGAVPGVVDVAQSKKLKELLTMLFLENSIVTINNTPKSEHLAQFIAKSGGHYIFQLNDKLQKQAVPFFDSLALSEPTGKNCSYQRYDKEDGGLTRSIELFSVPSMKWSCASKTKLKPVSSICITYSTTDTEGCSQKNCHYYSSDLAPNSEALAPFVHPFSLFTDQFSWCIAISLAKRANDD